MFKKNSNQSTFWISYADLMAGLLFIFILLIGAIISKSIFLREDLNKKKEALEKTTINLKTKEAGLQKLNKKVQEQKNIIKLQQDEIFELKSLLANRLKEIKKLSKDLNQTKETLVVTKNSLELKENEIKKLNQLLLAKNTKVDDLNGKIVILQNLLNKNNTTLAKKDKLIQKYKNKVLILSNNLTKKENELKLSSKKLKELLMALDQKKSNYEQLLQKIQKQKEQIKYLTGLRLKVIEELKNTLGDSLDVTKDGAMKLSSQILFDKGSNSLKEESKEELDKLFNKYINALFSNRAIAPYIENIVIEGHTDSDGDFLYNLELSQNRALSVMKHLLNLPIVKKYNLKNKLIASGRSYLDPVIINGKEDKDKSRRIEIKFRLKNQNALYEIERILDEDK